MTLELSSPTSAPPRRANAERVAAAVAVLRHVVGSLDEVFAEFDPAPPDDSSCPEGLTRVKAFLVACRTEADGAGLLLLSRVVARTVALVDRIRCGHASWSLVGKLALEDLVTVIDMVLDVVELVGVDSGCRQEERVSLRILATVAPQVLVEVDGLDFREIRFHQASGGQRQVRVS
jgi:hypothetical protein